MMLTQRPIATSSVTPPMVRDLMATRGWILGLSVLSWIFALLELFAGILLFALSLRKEAPIFRLIAYGYLSAGILTIIPALLLARFSSALHRFRNPRDERPVIEALQHEGRFWKFVAISTLVFVGLVLAGALIGGLSQL